MINFIELIKECWTCERNHSAELFSEFRRGRDLKLNDKWWSLCRRHYEFYDRKMCLFFDDSFED